MQVEQKLFLKKPMIRVAGHSFMHIKKWICVISWNSVNLIDQ